MTRRSVMAADQPANAGGALPSFVSDSAHAEGGQTKIRAARLASSPQLWPSGQSGFSLLEVLVTFIILSIGLLGIAAVQLNGLKSNSNANLRSQAAMLANDIVDRLRANTAEATSYRIDLGEDAPNNPQTRRDNDLAQWLTNLSQNLPSGDGSIDVNNGVVTITVQWTERVADVASPEGETQQMQVTTRL